MATQSKRDKTKAAASESSGANTEEALRPFQEASKKFAETTAAAQQAAFERWGKSYAEFQEESRRLEQEAMNAVAERNKKFFSAVGQEPPGKAEEDFASRARLQLEYENEVRQVYVDTQEKLASLAQKVGGGHAEEISQQFSDRRQEAYQAYLGDLQAAWSATTASDPQTMSAIALSILSTLNTCSA
ncbi:MAG: hypothetical protein KDD47_26420 [Acidobacteria bacterium]|nr:hypothetical protein [Acidobacteriota bacterium]